MQAENNSATEENKSQEPENKIQEPENKAVEPENKPVEENKSQEPENKIQDNSNKEEKKANEDEEADWQSETTLYHFLIPIIIFAVALALLVYSMQDPASTVQRLEQEAQKEISANNFEKAIQCLKEILEKQPEHYSAHYQLIRLLLAQGQTELAQYYLDIAIQMYGGLQELLELQASIYQFTNQLDAAEKIYLQLLENYPNFIVAKADLFILYYQKYDWEKAKQYLVDLETNHRKELMNMSFIFPYTYRYWMINGTYDKALTYIRWMLQENQYSFSLNKNCIEVLSLRGELPLARNMYKEQMEKTTFKYAEFYALVYANALSKKDKVVFLEDQKAQDIELMLQKELISALSDVGRYEEALKICESLQLDSPEDENQQSLWMEHLYYLTGNISNAQTLAESWQMLMDNTQHSRVLLDIALQQKDFEKAQSIFEDIFKKEKDKIKQWNLQPIAYRIAYEKGNFEEVYKIAEQMTKEALPGTSAYQKAQLWFAHKEFVNESYEKAQSLFHEIANNAIVEPKLRCQAAIWEGISAYFFNKSHQAIFAQYASFPWENYLLETEYSDMILMFAGKLEQEKMLESTKNKLLANDIYYYLGLYQEMQGNLSQALSFYTQSLSSCLGNEFPYWEAQKAQKRIQGLLK